jgi:hypothetical protein
MSEFNTINEIAHLRGELHALSRENKILHKWLEEERARVKELTDLLIGKKTNA